MTIHSMEAMDVISYQQFNRDSQITCKIALNYYYCFLFNVVALFLLVLSYIVSHPLFHPDLITMLQTPDNIGSDGKDDVKVFDFGLACEMTEERRIGRTQDFSLTRGTGSARYMAPEVATTVLATHYYFIHLKENT